MSRISRHPIEELVEEKVKRIFIDSVKDVTDTSTVVSFLNDLLSPQERIMIAKRISIAFLLLQGKHTYDEIGKILRVSKGTISKIHATLALQGEGFRRVLGKMILKKSAKNALGELVEILRPIPGKGANSSDWYKQRRIRKLKRQEPL